MEPIIETLDIDVPAAAVWAVLPTKGLRRDLQALASLVAASATATA